MDTSAPRSTLSPARWRAPVTLCLVLLGATGCYRVTRRSPLPVPIELVASPSFALYTVDSATGEPVMHCTVRQISATVDTIIGSTMHLRRVYVADRPHDASPCTEREHVLVLLDRDPQVKARTTTPAHGRSLLFVVASVIITSYVALLAAIGV